MTTDDRASVARRLTGPQKAVLTIAFLPMLATGITGAVGTFSNISHAYGTGTALGAVAAGEGATAVLALVLLGLTMLGQSSPWPIRAGLWALPTAAAVMAAMAGPDAGRTVIYAVTPMGMCVSAEGMAFLARRIVVHTAGRDAEAERKAATIVRALAYHQARAANHPVDKVRGRSERKSWRLARQVGGGDVVLGERLLTVQRERVVTGADAALAGMFAITTADTGTPAKTDPERSTGELPESDPAPITATVERLPAPAAVDCLKSTPTLKPLPSIAPPIGPRTVAADVRRPRRATGRVPDAARTPRTKRTPEQLLAEARTVTAGWPDAKITAEGIRRAVHTSPANARMLRDALRAERAA
ncbi:conjugal transfer protein [Streptomyces sp. A7024]|uniref:Conjugal transfer protein n=1 Tax=Streptomyces coryli TaxID=1128680 RepID=A0A6G4TW48_9ACTN|nr:conjugal transfer protein [Streptomyces coryli]NGN64114.1 conjugal transfer protein [Streptomyces coryli]